MRLLDESLRGLTTFTDEMPVTLDLAPYGPGLIAIVGSNGAGKTTVLEGAAAALYKELPSRPRSLYNYAHGADAFASARFIDGADVYEARVQINAARNLIESYLFKNGKPLTSGKAAEFTAEVEKHFGSRDTFLASVFAAQDKTGNFLAMPRAQRKEFFAELIALAEVMAIAERAKARRVEASKAIWEAEAVRKQLQNETHSSDGTLLAVTLEAQRRTAENSLSAVVQTAEACEASVEEYRKQAEKARLASARLGLLESEVARCEAALSKARNRLADLSAQHHDAQAAAERQIVALEAAIDPTEDGRIQRRWKKEQTRLEKQVKDYTQEVRAAQKQLEAAKKQAETEQVTNTRLRAEVDAQDALVTKTESIKRAIKLQEANDRRAQQLHDAARKRLEDEAKIFTLAPCTESEEWVATIKGPDAPQPLSSNCPLLEKAGRATAELAVMPTEIEHSESDALKEELAQVMAERVPSAKWVELQNGFLKSTEVLHALTSKIGGLTAQIEGAERALLQAKEEVERVEQLCKRELADAADRRERQRGQLAALQSDQEQQNAQFESRIEAERAEIRQAEEDQQGATAALQEAQAQGVESEAEAEGRLRHAQNELAKLHADRRTAEQLITALTTAINALKEKTFLLELKTGELFALKQNLSTWMTLEEAFGKNGIQALEIAAAGPAVATLTNDLLASCYGPRFSIQFETLRAKKSSEGFTETFDVIVYDGSATREFEALSGGEKVIVSEAIGLALAIYMARKSGVKWETLWRDETAGALDPHNARAYIAMLRRARELGGFYHVIFVSHVPEVWEAADVQFIIADKQIKTKGATA